MGGNPPIGYDVCERKLIVNQEEADLVNLIFRTFVKTRSIIATSEALKQKGYKTKAISTCTMVLVRGGITLCQEQCLSDSEKQDLHW